MGSSAHWPPSPAALDLKLIWFNSLVGMAVLFSHVIPAFQITNQKHREKAHQKDHQIAQDPVFYCFGGSLLIWAVITCCVCSAVQL